MWMVRPWFFALGILKKIHFSSFSNNTMQEWFSSVSFEQNFTCVFAPLICLSFNSCGTHLPTFWIFPISRRRLEIAWWLTLNCSASYFCVCKSSSAMLAIPRLRTFWVFRVPCLQHRNLQFWNVETIIHTFFTMKHVHHKLLQVIGMIPQQFSSNENKKLMLSANAPYLVQISSY